ncbi:FadD3 family acyl-CoA ligase [Nitriliruptor alkaliphilus]|uniref:FadD3 family acyl-CoA ligase n=1 Tax=Nitriliruptor alkaliphilus TaxID=427918 RepID=UPI000696FA5E|nr:FadD3 family acyl-CoA ligase [Nitriliruptor alkaliphilus]
MTDHRGRTAGNLLPALTVPGLVAWAADRFGDGEALVDAAERGGAAVRWSWRDLHSEVRRAAAALIAADVAPGDRVAIWAPNIHEWVAAALGALTAGATLVPCNTRYRGHEVGHLLEVSRATCLLTVTGFLGADNVALLRDARGEADGDRPVATLPHLRRIVVLRGEAPAGTTAWSDLLAEGAEVDTAEVERRAAAVAPDDVSDLIFTSGTTGSPKGVIATHGQTVRVFTEWADLVGLRADDRYLVVNPFFHTFGYKAGIVACLLTGATIVPHAVFDPDAVLDRIAAERISVLPGPPTLYASLLDHPRLAEVDRSSLRLAVTGAATIPVSLIERVRDELGFDTVLTAYGLTEATGVVTVCRRGDDAETVATTSGTAIPGVEVRVVDEEGRDVPTGERGEVVVRGYNVTRGYFEDPERTAETIDADGWLHTGDVGILDERGYLDIVDRLKDLFIVGGFNVSPAEVEDALLAHEDVGQVAVVGIPDERMGEVGCAFVVPAPGRDPDPERLVAWSRDRLANFKVPRRVEVVAALPVNASGKVLKHELRDRAVTIQEADA